MPRKFVRHDEMASSMLTAPDYFVIGGYFLFSLLIGLYFRRRSQRGLEAFFVGGRNIPWWLAGISMVATTFAADTPLAVTELVYAHGISGNWLWWSFLIGGMFTVFFFARLWRRTGVITEAELLELRYGGRPATFLRSFKAAYLGLFINVMVMGWVSSAMLSVIRIMLDVDTVTATYLLALLTAAVLVYTAFTGIWGVAATDFFQFILAMAGAIALAVWSVNSDGIGGWAAFKAHLAPHAVRFLPDFNAGTAASGAALSVSVFLTYVAIQWWASWYPGAEPGGGGYIAQRMMSTPRARDAERATLLFQILHYAVRPWPWIIAALAVTILYPALDNPKDGYVMLIRDVMPAGWRGVMVAGFFAAFMSTLSTQINWGASLLTNDLWLRWKKETPPVRTQIRIARGLSLFLGIIGFGASLYIESIAGVWRFLIEIGSGVGFVLILRWYWWRINAWSEITAMVAPILAYGLFRFLWPLDYPASYWASVGFVILAVVAVTLLTPAESTSTLRRFYQKVRPAIGWQAVGGTNDWSRIGYQSRRWLVWTLFALLLLYGGTRLIGA